MTEPDTELYSHAKWHATPNSYIRIHHDSKTVSHAREDQRDAVKKLGSGAGDSTCTTLQLPRLEPMLADGHSGRVRLQQTDHRLLPFCVNLEFASTVQVPQQPNQQQWQGSDVSPYVGQLIADAAFSSAVKLGDLRGAALASWAFFQVGQGV